MQNTINHFISFVEENVHPTVVLLYKTIIRRAFMPLLIRYPVLAVSVYPKVAQVHMRMS